MGRPQSSTLTAILPASIRRETLDLYLADGTFVPLSRGKVSRVISGSPVTYNNWIKSISEMHYSLDASIDRVTVVCQNVDSILGYNIASSLRLMDFAHANAGKVYQSKNDLSLIEDIPIELAGVVSNAEADEKEISFEVIVDYESLGAVLATRTLSPRGHWTHKNGIECTSTSVLGECPQTREGCRLRGREYEFGGWEFFEEPVSSPPGSGGNSDTGIGTGTGGGTGGVISCFLGGNKLWTPKGEIALGECADYIKKHGEIRHYSFNPLTGAIFVDVIEEVFEHEVIGYYDVIYEDGTVLNPTPEHPFFIALNSFKRADCLRWGQTTKAATERSADLFDSKITKIKWNSDARVKVYNVKSRMFPTYFCNKRAVHNKPSRDDFTEQFQ